MRIVDAHIHLWTSATAPPHHTRAPYSCERALRDMDDAGVAAAINCPPLWDPPALQYAETAATAHPGRFATMGWLLLDALLALARHSNVALKATAIPSMATQPFPFADTHELLRRLFGAYGATRMFWGTDITRMQCSWRECIRLFTEALPWLEGRDLELVMGEGVAQWIDWP